MTFGKMACHLLKYFMIVSLHISIVVAASDFVVRRRHLKCSDVVSRLVHRFVTIHLRDACVARLVFATYLSILNAVRIC